MQATISLIRREFGAYFFSPIAYAVMAFFLIGCGLYFQATVDQLSIRGPRGIEFPFQFMLGDEKFWLVFLIVPALLTMRQFAEESSTGTLEMLMTAPLRDWEVVLSKFAASFGFYLLLWLPTLLFLPIILMARTADGRVDAMPLWSSIVGIILAGAMFLSIGLLVSSLVNSQLVAALISIIASMVFVVGAFWRQDSGAVGWLYAIVGTGFHGIDAFWQYLSVPVHFQQDFSRGIVDTRHIVLYLSVTIFCLFLTVRSLESRRWR